MNYLKNIDSIKNEMGKIKNSKIEFVYNEYNIFC